MEKEITNWDIAAKILFEKHNPELSKDSLIGEKLLSAFVKDMNLLSQYFTLVTEEGEQITYHLPISKWQQCNFAQEVYKAPQFDGHTSEDVLKRISEL